MLRAIEKPKINLRWARIDRILRIMANCKRMKANLKELIIRSNQAKVIREKTEKNQASCSKRLKLTKLINHGKVNVTAQALSWQASRERHHLRSLNLLRSDLPLINQSTLAK
jgi:hypothetical protein